MNSFIYYIVSGVFITKGDVGVGTIVGSAVFNILVIIGVCGIFAGQVGFLFSGSFFPVVKGNRYIYIYRDPVFCFYVFIDDLSHLVASLPGLFLLHHVSLGFNSGETLLYHVNLL